MIVVGVVLNIIISIAVNVAAYYICKWLDRDSWAVEALEADWLFASFYKFYVRQCIAAYCHTYQDKENVIHFRLDKPATPAFKRYSCITLYYMMYCNVCIYKKYQKKREDQVTSLIFSNVVWLCWTLPVNIICPILKYVKGV